MSGLKVNFFKSKLYGVNLNINFLHSASVFLNCCIDCLPFKFLGVLVRASPRRVCMWKGSLIILEGGCHREKGWVCLWEAELL